MGKQFRFGYRSANQNLKTCHNMQKQGKARVNNLVLLQDVEILWNVWVSIETPNLQNFFLIGKQNSKCFSPQML